MNPSFSDYFNTAIKNAKNDLKNPRVTFNWGYHDNEFDFTHNSLRDISDHFDPYYAAGYNARNEERNQGIEYNNNSDNAWKSFVKSLSIEDKKIVRDSIRESIILGQEYLFHKKTPRNTFESHTWNRINEQINSYFVG